MPNSLSPVEALNEFREKLVEQRRDIVRGASRTVVSSDAAAAFTRVQEQIDAVDRAIADEERAEPS